MITNKYNPTRDNDVNDILNFLDVSGTKNNNSEENKPENLRGDK